MKIKREKVNSVSHLRELIKSGRNNFFILLAGGLVVSRKTIRVKKDDRFAIVNHIDDTTEVLTEAELFTASNIGEAITKGAFVAE